MFRDLRLGVNIDHAATLRNVREGTFPDLLRIARAALAGGAFGITVHLREDRRHIRDADVWRLRHEIEAPLNFEMAATEEMVLFACALRPHACCVVPEKRAELTTEGGLDLSAPTDVFTAHIARLKAENLKVSFFIEPNLETIAMSAALGAAAVELHTGRWCAAVEAGDVSLADQEYARLRDAACEASRLGMEAHAGHGLTYETAARLASVQAFSEFNIGHFLMSDALFTGLEKATRKMTEAMIRARAGNPEKDDVR